MDNNRLNELLIKEAAKSLTPLQEEELGLLRQLQDNIAAQAAEAAAAQAPVVEVTAPVEEIAEEVPVIEEPVVETPAVVEDEVVEETTEAPASLGVVSKN